MKLPGMNWKALRNPSSDLLFPESSFSQDRWEPSLPVGLGRFVPPANTSNGLLAENERPYCTRQDCRSHLTFWKKSARPVFEGGWVCGEECARQIIADTVQRYRVTAEALEETLEHRHRIPLGLMLVHRGLISPQQLQQALSVQREMGYGLIGEWLMDLFSIPEEKITRAVAAQWNRPVLSNIALSVDTMALTMPSSLRSESRMVPLRLAGGKILYTGFAGAVDYAATSALERMSGVRVESGFLSHAEFARAMTRLQQADTVTCRECEFEDTTGLVEAVVKVLFGTHPVASRLVPIRGKWWLRMWLEKAAWGSKGPLVASSEDVCDVVFRPKIR